jgi:hypothetical protein
MLLPAGGTEAPARVPFHPHRGRALFISKPLPYGASTPPQPIISHEPWNSAGGGAAGSNASTGTKQPPVSTPAPRVAAAAATPATLPAASSSRFLAPISLSRLNSVLEARRQKIKTEASLQATSRAAKRKVMDYVDLTEDDDRIAVPSLGSPSVFRILHMCDSGSMPLVRHTKFQFMLSPMPDRSGLHYTAVGLSAQPLLVVDGHICRRQLQAASGAVPLTFGREEVGSTKYCKSVLPQSALDSRNPF